MESPTISHLQEKGWVALEVILEESEVRRIIPALRQAGAKDIIEYPLNKVIP
jgi:ATP phosphoribosyltransferase